MAKAKAVTKSDERPPNAAKQGNGKKGGSKKQRQPTNVAKVKMAPSSLPWTAVEVPQEATAGDGQDDEDFHKGFSVDDDDFMGLTEVEGVEVIRDKDGTTKFVMSKRQEAKKPKAAQGTAKSKSNAKTAVAPKSEKGDKQEDQSGDLPVFQFEEEKEGGEEQQQAEDGSDSGSQHEEEQEQEQEQDGDLGALDFTVLADGELEGKVGWTAKELNEKLPQWKKLNINLHSALYQAIHKLDFQTPTDIQSSTLPLAIGSSKQRSADANSQPNRDVVGIAQTGSGKTLAYALPILHWIASNSYEDRQMRLLDGVSDDQTGATRLAALILTPTRELAIQVAKHISLVVDASSTDKKWASVATLTGGMSEEKQRRTLQGYRGRGVDIVVATPGRLWDICKGDDAFVRRLKATRFLVVDEADRMIETGHFAELQNIFALIQRVSGGEAGDQQQRRSRTATVVGGAQDMQTLIFSATLSKELQHNLKRANRKRRKSASAPLTTLDELFAAIDFRDEDPAIVDQSTDTRIAKNVFEVKMECLQKDKDLYLYYFLLRFPGRTLIFVNAIDGIRRLQPLLENIGIAVQPLHSQLQQKQRLKNMDRFKSKNVSLANGGSSVLLATDVAARGLDIADVDHVVHFQIPRSADTYVHRSGRTARAGNQGVSLALVDPTEKRLWHALCKSLQRQESTIPSMPIEYAFLPELKKRIELARQIDKATHEQKKEAHDDAWLRKLAQEAEMDLSDDGGDDDDDGGARKGKKAAGPRSANVAALRAQLRQLIQTPLRARGISLRYITSGSREFLESLLDDRQHDKLIGVERSSVKADVMQKRAPSSKRKAENAAPADTASATAAKAKKVKRS